MSRVNNSFAVGGEGFQDLVGGLGPHERRDWNEAYRTTYREYVANQREKDAAVLGVRAALSKPRLFDDLDPGWVQLVKFHNGAVALAE